MSAEVLSSWQQAADASDEAAELIAGLPGGDNGYELTPESDQELRQAAALLEKAAELLQRASERECPRYSAWCDEHEWALEGKCAEA